MFGLIKETHVPISDHVNEFALWRGETQNAAPLVQTRKRKILIGLKGVLDRFYTLSYEADLQAAIEECVDDRYRMVIIDIRQAQQGSALFAILSAIARRGKSVTIVYAIAETPDKFAERLRRICGLEMSAQLLCAKLQPEVDPFDTRAW